MPDSLTGPQLIFLGLAILAIGFLLRRSFVHSKRSRERDPAAEARQEIRAAERSAESSFRRLEVRLHDYGREVEGRVETTLTLLDRLILEADQETSRLQQLLLTSGQIDPASVPAETAASHAVPLTAEECQMVRQLKAAGHPAARIAHLLRRSEADVIGALQQDHRADESNRTDAA